MSHLALSQRTSYSFSQLTFFVSLEECLVKELKEVHCLLWLQTHGWLSLFGTPETESADTQFKLLCRH